VISVQGSLAVALRKRKKRGIPLLSRRKEHVTRAMSLCDCAQPRRVFERWLCGTTTLDLDEDDLQGVAASHDACGRPMVFANCQQIDDTNRFSVGLPIECNKLPTCPRYNLSNAHLRHRYSPSSGTCGFLLRFFPIHRHKSPFFT
jgi:hypothetical protein